MNVVGIIPSRYASTRFPGKPLVDINGKSMIQRVYEQARNARGLSKVVVATDDDRILNHVVDFGGDAVMTSPQLKSGTDRCNKAVEYIKGNYDLVINIQGDEPFIQPEQIEELIQIFSNEAVEIGTLVKKIEDLQEVGNPNVVKAVFDKNSKALYFSRFGVPFERNGNESIHYKHIGLYGYRVKTLQEITQLQVSTLEEVEGLEQLRWLENGYAIHIGVTNYESIGIDTPEDLNRVIRNKF